MSSGSVVNRIVRGGSIVADREPNRMPAAMHALISLIFCALVVDPCACAFVADRDAERAIYFTRTSFMMRPETFQS